MRRFLLLSVLVVGLMGGYCVNLDASGKTARDFVADAKAQVTQITVDEAKQMLEEGSCVFLDCREPDEFAGGHVPGAINLPRGLLEFKVENQFPDKSANIVVYCKSGGRGCLASQTLVQMGYTNVKNMDGGWVAWEKAGYPVE